MWTVKFWRETATIMVQVFFTVVAGFLVVEGAVVQRSIVDFDWPNIVGIAATAAAASLAWSLASGTPSRPGLLSRPARKKKARIEAEEE